MTNPFVESFLAIAKDLVKPSDMVADLTETAVKTFKSLGVNACLYAGDSVSDWFFTNKLPENDTDAHLQELQEKARKGGFFALVDFDGSKKDMLSLISKYFEISFIKENGASEILVMVKNKEVPKVEAKKK